MRFWKQNMIDAQRITMAALLSLKTRTNESKLLLHCMASKYKCANLISPTRSLPVQVKDVAAAILNAILQVSRYVIEMHISRYKVYHVNTK